MPFAAFDGELSRDRQHAFDDLGLHTGRQHVGLLHEHRLKLALHIDHCNAIKLITLRQSTDAAKPLSTGKDATRQADQHRAAQLGKTMITKRANRQDCIDISSLRRRIRRAMCDQHGFEALKHAPHFHATAKSIAKHQHRGAIRALRDLGRFLQNQIIKPIMPATRFDTVTSEHRLQLAAKVRQRLGRSQALHMRVILKDTGQRR